MPKYLVRVTNDEFRVEAEEEHPDAAAAAKEAIKGALEVGVEQVLLGKPFFGAEVSVADGDNHERFVVAVGATPLK
jgi:hypothetical protein